MQMLVGQMYNSGYGVRRNPQKAKVWISKAANFRSSTWKVSNKRPGYNASAILMRLFRLESARKENCVNFMFCYTNDTITSTMDNLSI
ncbi:hypothetical protein ZOSMA_149G00010 [Zostera marina]|uniref:Uncharacterized protein n=1 Tax=Zostera marina TaxID=29655 RepID=A0A0K9PWW2_ZOSMR|nr:hypothetical protein ZOSMA_149G00010 [Zostera marina]